MKNRPSTHSTRGFSLIEVLIAMAVFAVTALGLAALNKVSMDASVSGKERTAAANLAQFSMTWLHNEVASYAPAEQSLATISGAYLPLLSTSAGDTGWQLLSGAVRFDEYLSNNTNAKYATVDTAKYCVHYLVVPTNGASSAKVLPGNLFYASVLVTWPKAGGYGADWKDCTQRVSNTAGVVPNESDPNDVVPDTYNILLLKQILTRDFSNKV